MRPFPRHLALIAVLAAGALHPPQGAAQRERTIPPLHVAPVADGPAGPAGPSAPGLEFRVGEAPGGGARREPPAPSTQLAAPDAARILARLPALESAAAADSFAFPTRTVEPPRAGRVRLASFPPPDSLLPLRPAPTRPANAPGALVVVRAAPQGEVQTGAEVTVTFSQPMIPLSSVAAVEERPLPVRMSPRAAGRWRWLDVRTLVFSPEGRLPAATEYTVTLPAGTRSETGGTLAQDATFTFRTPALVATGGHPHGESVPREPVILVQFDQRIDPAAVARHVRVQAGGRDVPVRPAAEAEIEADPVARALRRRVAPDTWIALRPVAPLPLDAQVRVTVERGAPSAEGPLRTQGAQAWAFRTYAPLRVRGAACGYPSCRPGEAFVIEFNNPLDTAAFRPERVRVEPAIPGVRVSAVQDAITVQGQTRPNTVYTVWLDPALRDVHGQTLGERPEARFRVVAPYPALHPLADGTMMVLDPRGPRRISVASNDHGRLRIRVYQVEPAHWPAYAMPGRRPGPPGREVVDRVVETGGAPGETVETVIDLDEALGGRPGHLVVRVDGVSGEGRRQQTQAWVQATHIGLAAFAERREVTAWATSLADGSPVPGARVTVHPAGAAGTTDAAGKAAVSIPDLRGAGGYLVAEHGADRALLPFTSLGPRGDEHTVLWHALTDRSLYRPGEEVRFKGWARVFVRHKTGGVDLPRSAEGEVAWRVRDPRGVEIATGTSRLTALGGFDGAFRLPEGANLGRAAVELGLANDASRGMLAFQVQEFRRPEYEVAIDAPAGPHGVGESAEVSVRASYFAGGGLPGARVSWTLAAAPGSYTPPGWGAWRFGGHDEASAALRPSTRSFQGETDAAGRHAVRLGFDAADPAIPYTLSASATVMDANRQPWTAATRLLVHPAGVYAGLRTERAWLQPGEPVRLEIVVVDLEGRPVAGRPVRVRAEQRVWRQAAPGGAWAEVVADSAACEVVSGERPVVCAFPTGAEGGRYQVMAEVTDARGRPSRTRTSVWAWGSAPWTQGRGERETNGARVVRLVPDRDEYAPGDTARVLVQLPFWPARGLVTVRREGIVRTEPVASDGPVAAVSIPLGDEDIPNVHVQVDLVGTHDAEGRAHPTARGTDFAVGRVVLRVPPGPRTLSVTAEPSDSLLMPDAPGTVDVRVRDATGRPVAGAEVAVVMVDEAVLALTGFRLRHPVELFHPQWTPGVTDTHLRPRVLLAEDPALVPGEVRGVVVDAMGQPMAAVTVTVEGTARGAVTNARGRFTLRGVPPGRQLLRFARVGMVAETRAVVVGDAPVPELRVVMAVQALHLEEVVVTGVSGRERGAAVLLRGPSSISARAAPAPAASPPPEPEPGIALRTDFAALALWAPVVRTDAEGRARVPFTLPSTLTRYRLMAVAAHGGRSFGMDEGAVTARQPLMVRPSAPRFLNFGDRFELTVLVQNQTDAPLEVGVAARADGVELDEAGRRVTVPAHDRAEVRIAGRAARAGTARVQVAAVAGELSDAAEIALPVYTPATAEAFATYGQMAQDGAVELPLRVPDDAIPAFGGLEVTTSSTALHELTDAFLYLSRYPYECAEQIASRLLAVAALRDVLAEFGAPGLPPADSIEAAVARDLRRLRGMQRADGGFSFWPDERESWPYVSLHATHALVRMRARGYSVPDAMVEHALGYARRVESDIPRWYPASARLALRAYGAYVLDLAGDRGAEDALARLFREVRPDTVPLEVAGWLLSAAAGRPRFAAQQARLLRVLHNRATETASTATFATRYEEGEYLLLHSDRRTDAVVLEALLEAEPGNELATKTVRGLLGHRRAGRWESTQENSWVLLALDRYFRAFEAQTPEFVARVWLGQRFAGEQPFHGRTADHGQLNVPMRVLADHAPGSVTIGKEGPGRLYYRAGLRYAPRTLELAPLERGFAVDRAYEAIDDPADLSRGADGRWRVRAGARVRVTVTVTAPARRVHVAMVDPLPAGFEVVNTALRGAEGAPVREPGAAPWERGAHGWRHGPWYEHQNLRDDRVEAFTSLLPAGVYTYTYVARATTPGEFVVPPPRAEEMYSPETFGRGGTERVLVVEEPGERESPAPPP